MGGGQGLNIMQNSTTVGMWWGLRQKPKLLRLAWAHIVSAGEHMEPARFDQKFPTYSWGPMGNYATNRWCSWVSSISIDFQRCSLRLLDVQFLEILSDFSRIPYVLQRISHISILFSSFWDIHGNFNKFQRLFDGKSKIAMECLLILSYIYYMLVGFHSCALIFFMDFHSCLKTLIFIEFQMIAGFP